MTPSPAPVAPSVDERPPASPTGGFSDADVEVEEQVEKEKARALEEPGPSWRTWLLQRALRAYYLLGILIADVQIIVFWLEAGNNVLAMALSLAGALYLEFLLYRYLWYRPQVEVAPSGRFRPTWTRPAEFGRWTPEADLVRSGVSIYRTEQGPNPKEFL